MIGKKWLLVCILLTHCVSYALDPDEGKKHHDTLKNIAAWMAKPLGFCVGSYVGCVAVHRLKGHTTNELNAEEKSFMYGMIVGGLMVYSS